MVKSETRRDAEILVRNPSPRLFGEKFRDSKKVKTNHEKTRLRDLSKTLTRFRDPSKIFRDPRFSRYHSPPLMRSPPVFSATFLSRQNGRTFSYKKPSLIQSPVHTSRFFYNFTSLIRRLFRNVEN